MFDFLTKIKDVFIKQVPDTSDKGKVDSTDYAKLIRTGVLVGLAGALSHVITNMDPSVLGVYQPVIMMGLTVALDFLNKLIKGK